MKQLIIVDLYKYTKINENKEQKTYSKNNTNRNKTEIGNAEPRYDNADSLSSGTVFVYSDIVDLLIKAQKLHYKYPNADIACRLDQHILKIMPDIEIVLSSIYDKVIITKSGFTKNKTMHKIGYDKIKMVSREKLAQMMP